MIGIKFPALEICKLSWDNTNEREILLESHLIKECKHLQYLELTAYNVELQLDAADCYPCYNSTTKNVLIDLGKDIEKRSEAIKQQLLEAGLQQSPLIR